MRIFLAGIIQGSKQEVAIHEQDYRTRLAEILRAAIPDVDVYDPFAEHHESVTYSDEVGRKVFFHHNTLCQKVDAVVAFLPEASMGTAIEMWEAWQNGVAVFAVTPLTTNWVVRFLTHQVYETLEEFEAAVQRGEVTEIIRTVRSLP